MAHFQIASLGKEVTEPQYLIETFVSFYNVKENIII